MAQAVGGPDLRVLSLGAGVQSTVMALMAAHGEIGPRPDCAIFADTGWEPPAVYEHLKWLMGGNTLPFPVHVVNNGNIREMLISQERGRYAAVPFFLGNGGMGRRQCTSEYKLKPLSWKMRELLGKGRRERIRKGAVEVWIGITTDEIVRMKPSRVQWQRNRWPLIERRMNRNDCIAWFAKHYPGLPLVKSACLGCPFKSRAAWRRTRNDPASWADVIEVDEIIRSPNSMAARDAREEQFMVPDRVPLREADLDKDIDARQGDLWGNECEGMCGV